jgi:hypothetical protein
MITLGITECLKCVQCLVYWKNTTIRKLGLFQPRMKVWGGTY